MFFVKATLTTGVCVHVDIRNDNVYTHCHCCGEEMRVNLNRVLAGPKGTREDSAMLCKDCTAMLCKDCTDLLVERMRDS